MTSFSERIGQVIGGAFQKIKERERQLPLTLRIPAERVDGGQGAADAFTADQHYFQVTVNELYLTRSREWTRVIDPAVLVISEFSYNGQRQSVPVLVGPAMVEHALQQVPNGMVFYDTRVAGPHPYRGGPLTLTVVLYEALREDYARKMLELVERTASALSPAVQLTSYLKVADVVLGGVELLLGEEKLTALAALRTELGANTGGALTEGSFVLLDPQSTGATFDPAKLWVRERRLHYGASLAEAQPFREADYVLYSLTRIDEREPVSELPFYPTYEQMNELAVDPARKEEAKLTFIELQRSMVKSPDLSKAHRQKLIAAYKAELKEQLESSDVLGAAPEEEPLDPEQQAEVADALEVLNL